MVIRKFEPDLAPAPPPWGRNGGGFGEDTGVPLDFQAQLNELEEWAQANKKEAWRDAVAFWILKIPAMIASAGSGLLAYIDIKLVGLIAGFIAAVCVLIDATYPRGMLRNTHLRAYHDLRILTTEMAVKWRARKGNDDINTAKRIIRDAEPERLRIARYIRDAEIVLSVKKGA